MEHLNLDIKTISNEMICIAKFLEHDLYNMLFSIVKQCDKEFATEYYNKIIKITNDLKGVCVEVCKYCNEDVDNCISNCNYKYQVLEDIVNDMVKE